MRLSSLLAVVVVVGLGAPASAQSTNTGLLKAFQKTCLDNAPAFDSAAIEAAAQKAVMNGIDATASATASWAPGKSCKILARIGSAMAAPVGFEVADPIVSRFVQRMGGGTLEFRKAKRRDKVFHYRMKTPAGRFDIEFRTDGANQNFNVSKL
ncbi:MAG: hypothetical protein WBA91_04120 [Paracoccaceae bacterium]